jgi:hypothetical protein
MDNRKWLGNAIGTPPTPPASPSTGYPTNGDLLAPQPATEPGAWHWYALGEEQRNVLLAAGLTPSDTTTQLRDAIIELIRARTDKIVRVASTVAINLAAPGANIDGIAMNPGDSFLEKDHATLPSRGVYIWNGAAVPATRAPWADEATELASGMTFTVREGTSNADTKWQLTTDGTIVVGTTGLTFQSLPSTFASNAEAQGLSILTKMLSPGTLNSAFQGANQSLVANGYQKLPGGLILQWGLATSGAGGNTLITFPITFPSGVLRIITASPFGNIINGVGSTTSSNFNAASTVANTGAGSVGTQIPWFALGL